MIPKQLVYQNKVESAAARSYKSNIAPQNGTGNYGAGETIIINIPTRANLVTAMSENYLKFDVSFTNGANTNDYLRWDSCGAHGLIQRVRVFSGSNLLDDIDNYGMLAKMLFDIQVPTDSAYGKYNILSGTRPDLIAVTPTFLQTDFASAATMVQKISNIPISAYCTNTGARLNSGQLAAAAVQSGGTYCLNLISLVGSLCSEKYFPLFACTSAPLRVEIQLVASPYQAICSEDLLTSFTISNCEYVANMIELSDPAMQVIQSSTNGEPLQFVFSDYKNFVHSAAITAAATTVNAPIAAKYASLKSLLVALRDTSKSTAVTYFPYSSHHFNLLDYTFRIGPNVLPSKAPSTYPEMFSELVKAIGSMSDINHQPSIDYYSYSGNYAKGNSGGLPGSGGSSAVSSATNYWGPIANNDVLTNAVLYNGNVNSGSFYIGIDLENYTSADKSTVFAGYNSNTDDIYLQANFGGVSGGVASLRFDSYACFDSVIVFQNGNAYVKF